MISQRKKILYIFIFTGRQWTGLLSVEKHLNYPTKITELTFDIEVAIHISLYSMATF